MKEFVPENCTYDEAIDRAKDSLKKFRQRELDKAREQSQSRSHSKLAL